MHTLIIFLFLAFPLFSEEFSEVAITDIPDIEAVIAPQENLSEEPLNRFVNLSEIPSGIVANVNLITGDYCLFERDLTIPSSQPIHIERAYSTSQASCAHASGPLFRHWQTNCEGMVFHPRRAWHE